MNDKQQLEHAIDLAGGQSAFAAMINKHLPDGVPQVKQANVHSWLKRSKRGMPAEYAIPAQLGLKGQVLAADLCPRTFRPDVAVLMVNAA